MFKLSTISYFLAATAAVTAVACSSDNKTATTSDAGGGTGGSATGGKSSTTGGATGNTEGGTTGGSGNATGGTTGSDGGDAGPTSVTLKGRTVAAVVGSANREDPLAGVKVCAIDATGARIASIDCVTTGADGLWSFVLTPNQQIAFTLQTPGNLDQVIIADIGKADADRGDVRIAPLPTAAGDGGADAGDAGATGTYGWDPSVVLDTTKGAFNTVAVTPSPEDAGTGLSGIAFTTGVSFAVTPVKGVGPFYNKLDESYAPGATSTQGGYGAWFLNLDPGTYTVTATSATMDCTPLAGNGYGWPQGDGSSKFLVVKNSNTQSIAFICNPKKP